MCQWCFKPNSRLLSPSAARTRSLGRLDADDVHHAEVLMAQNVAVKDEVTNVRPAEVPPSHQGPMEAFDSARLLISTQN
jgi:hypothetical protein